MKALTPKQGIFIAEYLVDFNGTRAAVAAGVPEKSAAGTAARWLKNAAIARAIAERRARRVQKLEEAADLIDQQLANAIMLDAGRFYDEAGKLIPIRLLPEDVRRLIHSVEDERRGNTRVQRFKTIDKARAIELYGKRAGLFTERVDHGGRLTLEQLVCGAPADKGTTTEGV